MRRLKKVLALGLAALMVLGTVGIPVNLALAAAGSTPETAIDMGLTYAGGHAGACLFNSTAIATPAAGAPEIGFTKVDDDSIFKFKGTDMTSALRMNMFGLYLDTNEMAGQAAAAAGDLIEIGGVWKRNDNNLYYDFGTVKQVWDGTTWSPVLDLSLTKYIGHGTACTFTTDKIALLSGSTEHAFTKVGDSAVFKFNGNNSTSTLRMTQFGLYTDTNEMAGRAAQDGDTLELGGLWKYAGDNKVYNIKTTIYKYNAGTGTWDDHSPFESEPLTLTPNLTAMNHVLTFNTDKIANPAAGGGEPEFQAADASAVCTYNGIASAVNPRMTQFGFYLQVDQVTGISGRTAVDGDTIVLSGVWKYTGDGKYYDLGEHAYQWNAGSWKALDTSEPTDTEVLSVVSGHNGNQIGFLLSENDYTVATQQFAMFGTKQEEYNFLDKIEIHTKTDGVKTLKTLYKPENSWYKMWGVADTVSIDLTITASQIDKIVVPKDTVFPMFAYVKGDSAQRFGYVTTVDKTFYNQADAGATNPFAGGSSYAWAQQAPIVDMTLSKHIAHAGALTFTTSKIATPGATDPEYGFTAVDSTAVFTYNGAPSASVPRMNMFGLYTDVKEMTANAKSSAEIGDTIVIGGLWKYAGDDKQYNIQTVTYKWNGSTWMEYTAPQDLMLTKHIAHAGALTFQTDLIPLLGASDPEQSFAAMDASSVFTYNGTPSASVPRMNQFGLYTDVKEMTANAQATAAIGDEIVLGGLWSYAGDGKTYDIQTVKFTWDGSAWTSSDLLEWVDTDIANIQVRGANDVLLVFPTVHDYASAGITTFINNMDATYATLQNITVYKSDTEYKTLAELVTMEGSTGERYYNIWGENGCFAIDMPNGWGGEEIEKIVFTKGCQFPSYATTNGSSVKKIIYRLQDDVIFVSRTPAEDNISWERTFASTPIATVVTGAQVMGTDGDVRLVLSLETNDYDGVEHSYDISTKFADYNTLKRVVLYADGNPVSLADAVSGEDVYLNLWGTSGTISFALKPEYSLSSFDEATIQAGCEFAAYSYTLPDAQNKIAYTVGSMQKLDITRTSYAVIYYDESGTEMFRDMVALGDAFELRAVPQKAGYVGSWEGLSYEVMPMQNIEYYLTYEAEEEELEDTPEDKGDGDEEEENQEDEVKSPTTNDSNHFVRWTILLAGAMVTVIAIGKKKWNSIGEQHGNE